MHVTNKYPNKLTHGFSQALRLIVQQETVSSQSSPRELPGDIINSIRGQNKGRACGLFMDSLDVFIRLVNKEDPQVNKSIRILFGRIYNGQIDNRIIPFFTNTYLFCLYKDTSDPTKLRPIRVPTALRRIITNHLARTFRRRFASHLLPYNYAVGVDNGMDFVIKASQLAVEKYITKPQQSGRAPSRCYISLDLKNMFNEISRDKILQVIQAKFLEMLPLVSLLYSDPGTVFFRMADGTWNTQSMAEGIGVGEERDDAVIDLAIVDSPKQDADGLVDLRIFLVN